jgi:hypothetical protein
MNTWRDSSEAEIMVLDCIMRMVSGCMDGPKTVTPPISIPKPLLCKVDPWLDHSIFGVESLIALAS